jgi:hypothetical protein
MKRTVAKEGAALNAFCASYTQAFVDSVLVERFLDKFAFQCAGGAELVLRASVAGLRVGTQIAATEVAISTDGEGVYTFDGGRTEDAVGCATTALRTFFRIDLPDHLPLFAV